MNFDFTDDQQAIKRTAQRPARARASSSSACASLPRRAATTTTPGRRCPSSAGPGIFIDEEHGGQGLGIVELAILMEELGYALAPVPFLSNAAAGLALQFAGTDEQKQRWLPGHRVRRGARDRGHAARRRGAPGARRRLGRGDRADLI